MPQHKVSCFKLYQIWALAPQIQGGPLSQGRVQSGSGGDGGGGGGGGLVTKSCPTLATPWTITLQAPLGSDPSLSCIAVGFFTAEPAGNPKMGERET